MFTEPYCTLPSSIIQGWDFSPASTGWCSCKATCSTIPPERKNPIHEIYNHFIFFFIVFVARAPILKCPANRAHPPCPCLILAFPKLPTTMGAKILLATIALKGPKVFFLCIQMGKTKYSIFLLYVRKPNNLTISDSKTRSNSNIG